MIYHQDSIYSTKVRTETGRGIVLPSHYPHVTGREEGEPLMEETKERRRVTESEQMAFTRWKSFVLCGNLFPCKCESSCHRDSRVLKPTFILPDQSVTIPVNLLVRPVYYPFINDQTLEPLHTVVGLIAALAFNKSQKKCSFMNLLTTGSLDHLQ